MKVMGIDPSTYTGLAILDREGFQCTRLITFPDAKGCDRLKKIAQGVRHMVEEEEPDHIFIEGYGYKNKFTLVCLVEIGTAIRMALHGMGRTWTEIPPAQLKKWITGNGTANKDLMAAAVKEKWNFTSSSDDVVDGYALAQYGLAVINGEIIIPTKLPKKRRKKK